MYDDVTKMSSVSSLQFCHSLLVPKDMPQQRVEAKAKALWNKQGCVLATLGS